MQNFSSFTNQYELSKTLRFELKPVLETQRLLEENNVFEKDRVIQEKYIKTKKYLDFLHIQFVQESLQNFSFEEADVQEYESALLEYKKTEKTTDTKTKKTREKNIETIEKKLRKYVVSAFNNHAKIWATEKFSGLKNKNIKFLDEQSVFESVLLPLYGKNPDGSYTEGTTEILKKIDKKTGEILEEKEISIFEGWKGFTGYFQKFFETRRNFYKDDGTSTAIATRIVDNLQKFIENKWSIEKYSPEFLACLPSEKTEDLKRLTSYSSFILQGNKSNTEEGKSATGIDLYNERVGFIKYEANQWKQQNKVKIPHLKTLDKQILSPQEKFIDEIENDEDLQKELKNFLETGTQKIKTLKKLFSELVEKNTDFDLKKIYLTKKGFETLSRKYPFQQTENWNNALLQAFKRGGDKTVKYNKKSEKYTFPECIPLSVLKNSLEILAEDFSESELEIFWKEKYNQKNTSPENIWNQFLHIFYQEFSELLRTEKNGEVFGYEISSHIITEELQKKSLKKSPELTAKIKPFADNFLSIYQLSKYFSLEHKNRWNIHHIETDDYFYGEYYDHFFADSYETIVQPYNRLRNYLTKKPWEEVQKWKLNFENPTLAKGWDKNKETDNTAVIFRENGKYFLGILKKSANQIFADKNAEKFSGTGYEKMEYKLLPGANKMLPKVFFSASNIDFYAPSEKVLEIRNHSTHTKGGTPQKGFEKKDFSLSDCHEIIDFYKSSLAKHPDWKIFDFDFLPTAEYKDISGFYRDTERGGYKISWQNISEQYITEKNNSGELYLFQIKNKDWNEGVQKGAKKNLHTLYFENLFSTANAKENFLLKMNGEAEIFHRPKTAKEKLGTKKDNAGKEVINHKRYNRDTSFFHLPITFNRGTENTTPFQFNQKVNEFLADNPDVNILGIDRGEKHLAYFSLITQKGKILDSGSLNVVGNKDYHFELEKRAKDRETQRKDWKAVDDIKNLKKGYISLVVHKLAKIAIENNAIIVFEDLNMRFKQIRGGIEKSAYQQLEKALLDKLSFAVDKAKNSDEVGGVLKAHQLTAPVEAFKDMGKQTGIIFYTTAAYTSKIDPVTGWRPHLYLKYESAEKSAKLLKEKFDEIFWNAEKNRFEFVYTYGKKTWRVCSNVERWRGFRSEKSNNQWDYKKFPAFGKGSITQNLLEIFESEHIDREKNILDQVCTSSSAKLLKEIIFYFRLICQIRNTDGDLHKEIQSLKESENFDALDKNIQKKVFDEDFILSPVEGENGFFDSRNPEKFGENLPQNGDDNGAYNIARKGQILLQRISAWGKIPESERVGKNKFPALFVSNEEWDEFCQR